VRVGAPGWETKGKESPRFPDSSCAPGGVRTGAVTRQGRHRGEQHLRQRPLSRPPCWASPQSLRPCDQQVLDITVAVTCHKVNGDHCERARTCVRVCVRVRACVYVCVRVSVCACV